jgi:type 1 glutamine amidotransferase
MKKLITSLCFGLLILFYHAAGAQQPKFRALAIAEIGGGHVRFTEAAKIWLNKLAADSNFTIDYITDTKTITRDVLSKYQLFIQLNYPPYPWEKEAQDAFEEYMEKGKGGWIGFHHPALLGVFDGYPMWQWYSAFMGGIMFRDYLPGGASAKLTVEDTGHPVMKGLQPSFTTNDEWYLYDKSPRPNVHVLASIDESTYEPPKEKKMGDHPVIWTNAHIKAKNIFIAMGHFPELFNDENYTTLFKNAIFWAAKK